MNPLFSMWIYGRRGDLLDRVEGAEADLREQGVGFTTQRGQLAWTCSLRKNGKPIAECKRGIWTEVKP